MTEPTISFEVVERARQGDQAAFSWLFHRYHPRLAVFLHFHMAEPLRRKYELDDVMQELFLRAFRDLPDFVYRGPGAFSRWLFQIARHTVQDMARFQDRQKRQAADETPFRSPSNPAGVEPLELKTPSRILFQKEKIARLMAGLESLPANDRELVLLAKLEGLSLREISERTGLSKPAASLRLHRALQRLTQQWTT